MHEEICKTVLHCIVILFLTSGHSGAQPWASECPDVKNYKWWLNLIWHRMLYSCTHMATVAVKGLNAAVGSYTSGVIGEVKWSGWCSGRAERPATDDVPDVTDVWSWHCWYSHQTTDRPVHQWQCRDRRHQLQAAWCLPVVVQLRRRTLLEGCLRKRWAFCCLCLHRCVRDNMPTGASVCVAVMYKWNCRLS